MSIDEQIELCCSVMDDDSIPRRSRVKLAAMYDAGLPADANVDALYRVYLNRRFQAIYKGLQGSL